MGLYTAVQAAYPNATQDQVNVAVDAALDTLSAYIHYNIRCSYYEFDKVAVYDSVVIANAKPVVEEFGFSLFTPQKEKLDERYVFELAARYNRILEVFDSTTGYLTPISRYYNRAEYYAGYLCQPAVYLTDGLSGDTIDYDGVQYTLVGNAPEAAAELAEQLGGYAEGNLCYGGKGDAIFSNPSDPVNMRIYEPNVPADIISAVVLMVGYELDPSSFGNDLESFRIGSKTVTFRSPAEQQTFHSLLQKFGLAGYKKFIGGAV